MAQLVPLSLTVSCFSKIQIGFTFLVPAHPSGPGKRAVKRVCCVVVNCWNLVDKCFVSVFRHAFQRLQLLCDNLNISVDLVCKHCVLFNSQWHIVLVHLIELFILKQLYLFTV